MPYLVRQSTTAINTNGESFTHSEGDVISDWELADFIREKIREGSEWYRERFEPLMPHEAHSLRVKATMASGDRINPADNQPVKAPWDDYIGLHPAEVVDRMRDASLDKVKQTKLFESLGMNRPLIIDFVSPAEREPWMNYDEYDIRMVLEKFSLLSDAAVADAIAYERAHKTRPAILEWDRSIYEGASDPHALEQGAAA
jgi:hypothetical protein